MVEAPPAQQPTENPPEQQQDPNAGAPGPSIPIRTNAMAEVLAHDHLKAMLNKNANKGVYRPYASKLVPRPNHSPFGDFPKEFLKKKPKEEDFSIDIYEKSQAASATNEFITKGLGTGGKCTSKQKPKPKKAPLLPVAGATQMRSIPPTNFRRVYDVGDLPVQLNHGHQGGKLLWKTKVSQLNYNHYLPIFFEGLREKQDPYRFIAVQGTFDMLEEGGANIGKVIPQLIIPIKGIFLNLRNALKSCFKYS